MRTTDREFLTDTAGLMVDAADGCRRQIVEILEAWKGGDAEVPAGDLENALNAMKRFLKHAREATINLQDDEAGYEQPPGGIVACACMVVCRFDRTKATAMLENFYAPAVAREIAEITAAETTGETAH